MVESLKDQWAWPRMVPGSRSKAGCILHAQVESSEALRPGKLDSRASRRDAALVVDKVLPSPPGELATAEQIICGCN
jgi:hypothetical protein